MGKRIIHGAASSEICPLCEASMKYPRASLRLRNNAPWKETFFPVEGDTNEPVNSPDEVDSESFKLGSPELARWFFVSTVIGVADAEASPPPLRSIIPFPLFQSSARWPL